MLRVITIVVSTDRPWYSKLHTTCLIFFRPFLSRYGDVSSGFFSVHSSIFHWWCWEWHMLGMFRMGVRVLFVCCMLAFICPHTIFGTSVPFWFHILNHLSNPLLRGIIFLEPKSSTTRTNLVLRLYCFPNPVVWSTS